MNSIIKIFSAITFLCVTASAVASEEPNPDDAVVAAGDLLPVRVIFQVMGKGMARPCVLLISDTEIQLQRWGDDSKLSTVATMPMDLKEFEAALTGVKKDYFRGTVTYKNPSGRDGGITRMITKMGDISEYLVFVLGDEAKEKWPQAILRLKPLFDQFGIWLKELSDIEESNKKKRDAEQAVPSDGHKPSSRAPSTDPAAPADAH